MLGLTRLDLNNRDDVNTCHRIPRQAAENRAGHPQAAQRLNATPRDANGDPQPSLR